VNNFVFATLPALPVDPIQIVEQTSKVGLQTEIVGFFLLVMLLLILGAGWLIKKLVNDNKFFVDSSMSQAQSLTDKFQVALDKTVTSHQTSIGDLALRHERAFTELSAEHRRSFGEIRTALDQFTRDTNNRFGELESKVDHWVPEPKSTETPI
jgi:hypothetical protein